MGILILLILITAASLALSMSQKTPDYSAHMKQVDFEKIEKLLKK